MGLPRYWANTSTRNLVIEDTDFTSGGLGPKIAMTRALNSDPLKKGMFGNGWTFSYESSIMVYFLGENGKRAYLKKGSGQELLYTGSGNPPPGEMVPPEGVFDRLTDLGTETYLLEEKETHDVYRYEDDPNQANAIRRLTSITDKNGNAVVIAYNANSTIQSITDAAGRITSFEYDGNNHCTRMLGPDGRAASYAYDAVGNLIRTTDFAGNVTEYLYDAQNYVISMTTAGKTTAFTYEPYSTSDPESPKRISAITDARGFTETYGGTYLDGISIPDACGGVYFHTNENGQTTSSTNPLGQTTSKQYSNGLPTTWIDYNGYTWTFGYDDRGNLLVRFDPATFSLATFTYDEYDYMLSLTNPDYETWQYTYDESHNLIQKTSPSGRTERMTYDSRGLLATVTNAKGDITEYTRDLYGNVTSLRDPLGNISQYSYDSLGLRKISATDPRNMTTLYTYDNNDRLTKVTNPDGTFNEYLYDCCAMTGLVDENGRMTTYERNNLLYPTTITDPLGHSKTMEYSPTNQLIKTTDAKGNSVQTTYTLANRPLTTIDEGGGVITYDHDGNGNLLSVKDQRNNTYAFTYDGSNRLINTTDPLGNIVANSWDPAGRLVQVINARHQVITFEYNTEGELIAKGYDGGQVATYSYDATGSVSRTTDAMGTTTYTRDAMGRATSIQYQDGTSLAMTYDASGNVASISYPDGFAVSYEYDTRNRASRISWGEAAMSMTYDGVGNILSEITSNGTSSSYNYDANNRLIHFSHTRGQTVIASGTLNRDPVGNIIEESGELPILPVVDEGVETGSYNALNQVVSFGGDTYSYDLDGNLTGVSGARSLVATYDPENRVTSVTQSATTTYLFGAAGHRVRATVGANTRNYHHDPAGRLMFETDGNGQVTAYYIYRSSSPVAMAKPGGMWYVYHQGRTGNILALTDKSGSMVRAYAYSPFGEVVNEIGSLYNPFTFAGGFGVMDDGNGLFFMKNRHYDAVTGRFLQKDPIGVEGGVNLYAYVKNNPINHVDPSGFVGFGDDCYFPPTQRSEEADREFRKGMEDAYCYVADKAIGMISSWAGAAQGLAKALGYAVEGDSEAAGKEVLKTVSGPVGNAVDIAEDCGYNPWPSVSYANPSDPDSPPGYNKNYD